METTIETTKKEKIRNIIKENKDLKKKEIIDKVKEKVDVSDSHIYFVMRTGEYPIRERNILDLIFNTFLREMCIINKGLSIKKDILYNCFREYSKEHKLPIENKNKYLTHNLTKIGIDHNNRYYIGIYLNKKGIRYYEDNIKTLNRRQKIYVLSSGKKERKIKSYIKTMFKEHLESLKQKIKLNNNKLIKPKINYLKTKYTLKELEKMVYKYNIDKRSKTKLGLVIYISSKLNQRESAELFETTDVSLRRLKNQIDKNLSKEEKHRLYLFWDRYKCNL